MLIFPPIFPPLAICCPERRHHLPHPLSYALVTASSPTVPPSLRVCGALFTPMELIYVYVWGYGGFGAKAKIKNHVYYKMLDKYEFSQNFINSDVYQIPP